MPGLHRVALKLTLRADRDVLIHDLADTIRTREPLTGPGIRSPLAVLLYRRELVAEMPGCGLPADIMRTGMGRS
ncbi:hypothetical protein [Embleya sp. NBC_00896]|uniref:hypothetical protein n=1 Tax=Embleya sp. NBC_00896 TaxID=2975961 RepID=UPI003867FE37|nr:hypothetical protein OG928_14375 [Embleya sp. NBC_00896]